MHYNNSLYIYDKIKSYYAADILFIFAVLGIIITNSAIVVLAVTGFYLLYKYHNYKRILIFVIGLLSIFFIKQIPNTC